MPRSTATPGRIVDETMHLGAGFHDQDRTWVLDRLTPLGKHLTRWPADGVAIEVSVRDRDGGEQRIALEASIPRLPHLVAHASAPDLGHALVEARKDLIRQIDEEKRKRSVPPKRHGGRPACG